MVLWFLICLYRSTCFPHRNHRSQPPSKSPVFLTSGHHHFKAVECQALLGRRTSGENGWVLGIIFLEYFWGYFLISFFKQRLRMKSQYEITRIQSQNREISVISAICQRFSGQPFQPPAKGVTAWIAKAPWSRSPRAWWALFPTGQRPSSLSVAPGPMGPTFRCQQSATKK